MLRSLPRIAAAALPRGSTAPVLARACPTLARPQLCHLAQRPRTFATDTPATAPASATSAAASKAPAASAPTPPRDPLAIIKHDISTHRVFVYMKGHPLAPSCGYSQQVVQILRKEGVDFGSRNVMEEEDIRSAIKEFSKWPTIPQVFLNGEFIGGADILLALYQSGELADLLDGGGAKTKK